MNLQAGARLGPYEIIDAIGSGGMGEVFRARDTRLGRTVAIKVLRREVASDQDRIERFEREAKSASALNHPNIVTIYDVGTEGTTSYLAMEWVDGSPLRYLMERGKRQSVATVVSIGAQIAEGLARAHAAGIVHRDLKPDNVMMTPDGLVKILDFGLAKLTTAASDLGSTLATHSGATAAGVLLGTVGYMSPEQAVGRQVDYRSDQFALGIILYELATGQSAFRRDSAPQTLAAIIEEEPEPIQTRNPHVPPQLSRVIARALSKKPADRYESTRDLARDLRDLVHDTSSSRIAVAAVRRPFPIRMTIAAGLAIAIAAGAAWWAVAGRRAGAQESGIRRVVAVLPFRDLTGDPQRSYLAAGVTEEIRNQLTRISALRLLSRGAVQRYGDADVRRLRTELGAGTAIEGSVRLNAQRLRVAVELIDTGTEQTLWSEQYDRPLDDVLSVQTDVAVRIASALDAALTPEERTRVAKPPTTNPKAHEIYLRSQELTTLERQQNLRAINLLRQSLQLDPSFAVAQARLAYRLYFMAYYDDEKYIDAGIEAAQRAIEMDPMHAPAHYALASSYAHKGWASRSRAAFLKAQELDPGDGVPLNNIAVLESEVLGRHDEAIAWALRRLATPPVDANAYYHLVWPLLFLRDDATSLRWLNEGQRQFPTAPRLKYLHAGLDYLQGDATSSLARVRKIVEEHPAFEEGITVNGELAFLTGSRDAEAAIERLFRKSPGLHGGPFLKQETHQTTYGFLLMKRGDRARAGTLLDDALERAHAALADGNENQRVPFEIAAIHAVRRQHNQALAWLDKAVTAGYADYSTLARHPIFEPLRAEARFQSVLGRMQRRVSSMRERSSALAELQRMPFPSVAAR